MGVLAHFDFDHFFFDHFRTFAYFFDYDVIKFFFAEIDFLK